MAIGTILFCLFCKSYFQALPWLPSISHCSTSFSTSANILFMLSIMSPVFLNCSFFTYSLIISFGIFMSKNLLDIFIFIIILAKIVLLYSLLHNFLRTLLISKFCDAYIALLANDNPYKTLPLFDALVDDISKRPIEVIPIRNLESKTPRIKKFCDSPKPVLPYC